MKLQPIAIDKETAAQYLALSLSTLENLMREGSFPKPRVISPRRIAFIVSELAEWLSSRPVSDLLPPPNTGAFKPKRAQ